MHNLVSEIRLPHFSEQEYFRAQERPPHKQPTHTHIHARTHICARTHAGKGGCRAGRCAPPDINIF